MKVRESERQLEALRQSHRRRHSALQMSFCQSLWVDLCLTIQLRLLSLCGGFCVCWLDKNSISDTCQLKTNASKRTSELNHTERKNRREGEEPRDF